MKGDVYGTQRGDFTLIPGDLLTDVSFSDLFHDSIEPILYSDPMCEFNQRQCFEHSIVHWVAM